MVFEIWYKVLTVGIAKAATIMIGITNHIVSMMALWCILPDSASIIMILLNKNGEHADKYQTNKHEDD